VDGIGSLSGKFVDAGIYAVEGFIRGLSSLGGRIWDAGAAIGRRALDAAEHALDINSPSKEFESLGIFSGLGFVGGLVKLGSKVSDTAANMGYSAIDSMSSAISGISDVVNSKIDSQPVIRPVLDLTDIQNGTSNLFSMMNGVGDYSINGSLNTANSTAGSIQKRQSLSDVITTSNAASTGSTNTQVTSKQPLTLQLMLQNGKAIAEYIIDDVDSLMGSKNKITGRLAGV
jgi:hypothetical protein